jgi:TonB-linked SusC/RagA family outer membrane protein
MLADNNQTTPADKTISGVVLDVEGNALIGASIAVGNTGKGTVTDIDGNYTIKMDVNENKLIFSYIGFLTQEIEVKEQSTINVVLREATQELSDVVVVGYGIQKKVSVTASISTIEPKTLISVPAPSLSNTLGGQLPGIITRQTSGEPGFDGAQIYIRGISTWGNAAPLILVDGIERDINLINAYEIESFSIMKDASATAVYGVRGANGVILINTKKGKKGKPQVSFRTEWGSLTGIRFPDYIDGYEFAGLMNEALSNSNKPLAWTDEELEKFRTGSDPYLYPNVNWTDAVYKKHSNQTMNNLSVSGGTESTRYFVNAGYTSHGGLYQEDKNNPYDTNSRIHRYNFRSNIDIDVTKDLLLNLGLGSIIENRNYQGTPAQTIADATKKISPINYPIQNPDGSVGGGPGYMQDNPWGLTTQSGYATQFRSTLQGTFALRWDLSRLITKGLSVSGKFAFDHFYFSEVFRRKAYEVKQYLGKDPVTEEDLYSLIREGNVLGYAPARQANRAYYWEVAANYEKQFGDHRFMGMFLFNRREYVDLEASTSIYNLPYRRQGLAARLAYDYGSRYLFEFNMGYNGSENFPAGKRYGFFPSLSAGWVLSNENFWNGNLINHLKIRASYGQVGNDRSQDNQRFLYVTRIDKNASGYWFGDSQQFLGGMAEAQTGSKNVTWEVSTKANAGFDIGLFNNAVFLQVDAFHEDRTNILQRREVISNFAGFAYSTIPQGNIGEVKNKGLDAMLEVRKTTANGFYYSFRANFTFARSEIIEDDQPEPAYPYLWRKGNPVGQPFGLIALGFFEDEVDIANSPTQTFQEKVIPGDIKYKDVNDDGVVDVYDRRPIGYPATPEIMFGFGGTVAYKGFDATIHFSGVANRSNFLDLEGMYPFMLEFPNYNVFREYYDNRWISESDNSRAKYPVVIAGNNPNNYQTSTLYMRDASYLKLQNAEIGYTLPQSLTQRVSISNLRLFINGTNLLCFDKIKIVDPEFNITGGYPQQRVINFGAQIDF